jgi:serine/threonine-protein phosphatase 4 regulatory subunit 2
VRDNLPSAHTRAHDLKWGSCREPPFTIQRFCELAIRPREHYSLVGKYLRALERTLLVTSTWGEYIVDTYTHEEDTPWAIASNEALIHATTPIFSPIPFLENSRGASSSPPPLALDNHRGSGNPGDENTPPRGMSMMKIRTLKVDELDDLDDVEAFSRGGRRGHLAEHPEASASGTTGIGNLGASGSSSPTSMRALNGSLAGDISPPPLSDRFVRSSTPEPSPTRAQEENKREAAAAAASTEGSPSSLIEEGELEDVTMSPF